MSLEVFFAFSGMYLNAIEKIVFLMHHIRLRLLNNENSTKEGLKWALSCASITLSVVSTFQLRAMFEGCLTFNRTNGRPLCPPNL